MVQYNTDELKMDVVIGNDYMSIRLCIVSNDDELKLVVSNNGTTITDQKIFEKWLFYKQQE